MKGQVRKQSSVTQGRYITCAWCGGVFGTMIKVGDNKYRHERESSCEEFRMIMNAVKERVRRTKQLYGNPDTTRTSLKEESE